MDEWQMRSSKWWENLSGQKETSESGEQKLAQGSKVVGQQGGCRVGRAAERVRPQKPRLTLVNPGLGENRPKHPLFQTLRESKHLFHPDQSAGHRNEPTWGSAALFPAAKELWKFLHMPTLGQAGAALLFCVAASVRQLHSPTSPGAPKLGWHLKVTRGVAPAVQLALHASHLQGSPGSGSHSHELQIPRSCQRGPVSGSHWSKLNTSPGADVNLGVFRSYEHTFVWSK